MKSLRRSFNNKEPHVPQISTPIPAVSKPASAIQPPKKVIRAIADYRPQAPNQIGFRKGDFFHVTNEIELDGQGWYEANNPMTGARGLVPKSKFEEFQKGNAAQRVSQSSSLLGPPLGGLKTPTSPRLPVFYAIVKHDFEAERADELDAKANDPITVVAQSNYEWFVAKPISRLGRPGLIPVTFVSLHDPTSGHNLSDEDVENLMRRGDIPNVEDWKQSIIQYKAASIPLGVIEDEMQKGSVPNSPYTTLSSQLPASHTPSIISSSSTAADPEPRPSSPSGCLPPGILLSAQVASWHQEAGEYWFRINALFQPDEPQGPSSKRNAKALVLFRVYNDFYDFQVDLLQLFPMEAGKEPYVGKDGIPREPKRILPFMPGPTERVDDKVTNSRREELDTYVYHLCNLWEHDAEHILRHDHIRQFFAPKTGDLEDIQEPAVDILAERKIKKQRADASGLNGGRTAADPVERVRQPFSYLKVKDPEDEGLSDGSQYDDGHDNSNGRVYGTTAHGDVGQSSSRGPSRQGDASYSTQTSTNSNIPRTSHDRERVTSPSPYPRSHSPYSTASRTQSPLPERVTSPIGRSNIAPQLSRLNTEQSAYYTQPNSPTVSAYPLSATPTLPTPTSTTRARSGSTANNPQISATNPNTAFIKIKIFDRLTQDLIAIRVSPRVTHEQLLEKVRARLGDDVGQLSYRSSVHNTFTGLHDDKELKEWLEGTDKHVLYAD